MAANVLQQINRDPAVNLLAKVIPDQIPRPENVDWAERFDEATLLLANNKIVLAENKLESLRRSIPLQPSILSGLLICAVWRGDYEKQIELLQKLSECENLSADERARYLATSFVVGPDADPVSVEKRTLTTDIDSIDETTLALSAHARFADLPADFLQQLKGENEVGPRAAFQLLDRDPPSDSGIPSIELVPESIALVTLYGRETDRAARVEVIGVTAQQEQTVRELLGQALIGRHFESEREGALPLNYIAMSQPGGLKITDPTKFEELQQDLFIDRALNKLAETQVPLLGNQSLKEAASDDSKWLARAALIRYLEGDDGLVARDATLIDQLCEIGDRPKPETIRPSADQIEEIAAYDLNRVDPSGLDAESLAYLIQRSQQISATAMGQKASRELIAMELPDGGELQGAKLLGYSFLMQTATSSDEAVEHLEAAKKFAADNAFAMPSLLLAELPLRLRRGEGEKFQQCVQTIARQHGNDPEIMARLQQLLVQFGLIRPDGSPVQPRRAAAPAGGQGGGLWTPGGSTSAAPPSGQTEGGPAPSKLWVPGMD